MKRYTGLGLKWEWLHSLWLLFVVTPVTLPISYFYVGVRMQQKKWIYIGFIYFILLCGVIYSVWKYATTDNDVTVFSVIFVVLLYFNGIGRAIIVRKDYLIYLAENMDPEKRRILEEKESVRRETVAQRRSQPTNILSRNEAYKRQSSKTKYVEDEKSTNKRVVVINMNKASEREISSLPSIGKIVAKQIVLSREKLNEYTSFEHLVKSIGIQEHLIEEARSYMAFSDEDLPRLQKELEAKLARRAREERGTPGRSIDL